MIKPEGYPDLVKVTYLGDEFLIDYKEGQILPIQGTRFSPDLVFRYLYAEGFLIPELKETDDIDLSRN